ncbi:hypothetical protein AAEO56_08045 [Flavobacterium sp. DGU11]|uniref:Uncharacterized protein n=1 Tax=Flavobacterium arundinis TaxID=3139143 RepID=A0ABU9HVM0_9FLAO
MKTDRYTKIILTIIAACMVINVIEKIDLLPLAYASEPATKPSADFVEKPGYGLVPLNKDGSINVKMTTPTDVNLIGIKTYDELNVNVNLAKIGGYSTYGEIPVKVKE